jgi:hypothetical protein
MKLPNNKEKITNKATMSFYTDFYTVVPPPSHRHGGLHPNNVSVADTATPSFF